MTIAENTESKSTDSTNISNINNEVLERSSLNEDSQRPEEASNSSTEGNPLLETDGKNSSVRIDVSIAKSNRTDKDEDDRASMNASRKDADDRNVIVPPDGGLRAWMVMIGSFIINGVLFSVINTYSSIYLELQRRLLESGETGASSKAETCSEANSGLISTKQTTQTRLLILLELHCGISEMGYNNVIENDLSPSCVTCP